MQENSMNIEKGDILFGPLWPNQIKVKDIEKINDNCFKLIFLDINTNKSYSDILSTDVLKNIKIIKNKIYFNEDATIFFLALESIRFRYASLYDPFPAMNVLR
jgi:hypothetical protein